MAEPCKDCGMALGPKDVDDLGNCMYCQCLASQQEEEQRHEDALRERHRLEEIEWHKMYPG